MGGSCSKMMENDPSTSSQPHYQSSPTVVELPPPQETNNKRKLTVESSPSQQQQHVKRSLFRVGSRRTPTSPARASNYNHVQDAVALNFQRYQTQGGVVGLANLGNTCFLNSSLQCLAATIPLTDYFLGYNYKSELNKDNPLGTGGKLAIAYAELMKQMWLQNNIKTVIPKQFKQRLETFAPQFRGSRQHDAQELLAFLLDGIHEDLNRIQAKPYIEDPDYEGSNDEQVAMEAWKNYLRRDKSLIVDIFQGQLKTTLQCLMCHHRNIRFEPFMYLSLPMLSSDQVRTTISLQDCLQLYCAKEKLTGDNQWYCSKCKQHRDATKKTDLWIVPPILIVHLKRFRFNEYGHAASKNTASIDYPLQQWDLSSFVKSQGSERPLYDLYAIANHVGGLGSGHYTAYAMSRFDDQWYEFNDSSYRQVEPTTLQNNSSSAYLLFYNRVDSGMLESDGSTSSHPRAPLIRRQSVSRPDLWPHMQVQNSQFRLFSRSVRARMSPPPTRNTGSTPPLPPPPFFSDDNESMDQEYKSSSSTRIHL